MILNAFGRYYSYRADDGMDKLMKVSVRWLYMSPVDSSTSSNKDIVYS